MDNNILVSILIFLGTVILAVILACVCVPINKNEQKYKLDRPFILIVRSFLKSLLPAFVIGCGLYLLSHMTVMSDWAAGVLTTLFSFK